VVARVLFHSFEPVIHTLFINPQICVNLIAEVFAYQFKKSKSLPNFVGNLAFHLLICYIEYELIGRRSQQGGAPFFLGAQTFTGRQLEGVGGIGRR
jgi:hypothetical protein